MKKVKEKMIKNLHIENFQSHKDTGIQFQPGVNVIIGGSDKGKSAIIRALNWVCNNKPIGNAFMSNWGGETIVTLDKVKRRRTKSKNEYYLAPIETPLLAFKNDPPLEILNYFNMGDINWQHQHDSSFLLSSSDGEVARMLNKTVDLTIIDTSHANINKAITAANTDKKYCEANIKDIEIKLEDFDEVEAMQKAVKKVKRKTGYKSK
ncbi:AAA family ATPase, partial [Candidatus Pacearchaeota archaeon]|nr:AAA family ATPase [Candidatus Pacearchaeota archaeon]